MEPVYSKIYEPLYKQKLRKKYHKGLGTSSNKEVMETFGERMVEYVHDDLADEAMRMVFSSNRSDDIFYVIFVYVIFGIM